MLLRIRNRNRDRNRTAAWVLALLVGLSSTAMAQDEAPPASKSGKWFPWLSWNRPEGDVDLNKAVPLSSSRSWGLKKLGKRLFGPSKPADPSTGPYSVGDVRVNGSTAKVLGPGSYKLSSKGWQSSSSPYHR